MPKQFHPRKRGVHRVACIALYRALLSKCPKIEVPAHLHRGRIHPVAEIVHKQFRRNAQYESKTLIVAALKVGYEAEELLHNAINGNPDAQTKILSLLDAYQAQSRATRVLHETHPPPPPKKHIFPARKLNTPLTIEVHPRPSSEIKGGVRKVPKLINANGYPFLRYSKPQSAFLTRVLSDKIKTTVKRHTLVNKLEEQADKQSSVAAWENDWETHVTGKGSYKELGWREMFAVAAGKANYKIWKEGQRVKEVSKKMTDILLEERRLAEEEKGERQKEREGERKKRIRQRKTEEERRKRNEYLDSLPPKEREKALANFRKGLEEKKLIRASAIPSTGLQDTQQKKRNAAVPKRMTMDQAQRMEEKRNAAVPKRMTMDQAQRMEEKRKPDVPSKVSCQPAQRISGKATKTISREYAKAENVQEERRELADGSARSQGRANQQADAVNNETISPYKQRFKDVYQQHKTGLNSLSTADKPEEPEKGAFKIRRVTPGGRSFAKR